MKSLELNKILDLHKKWLNNEPDGVRADLNETNLRGADLRGAKLREANLRGASLWEAKNVRLYPMRAPKKVSSLHLKSVMTTLLNSLFQQMQNVVLRLRENAEQATPRCCQSQRF